MYLRHTVAPGYTLTKSPPIAEKISGAHLFKVDLLPGGKQEVVVEEATPIFKTADIRSPGGMEMVRVYLSAAATQGPLKAKVADLIKLQQDIGNLEQRIVTTREQMGEYRQRMDELHLQIVTLRAVKSAGPLMQSLEKKMTEVSDRLSKSTIDLVSVQEKLMIARVNFQDGVADLSLELFDFAFRFPVRIAAGRHLIHAVNRGTDPHEMDIYRVPPGKSMADFVAWSKGGEIGQPPLELTGGGADFFPGHEEWIPITLRPGRYLIICTITKGKHDDAPPHYSLGMTWTFVVD